MNQTLQRILTSQDPIMMQARENLMANKMHDESATQAYDRMERHGMLGRLLEYGSIVPRPADSAANAADTDLLALMPE